MSRQINSFLIASLLLPTLTGSVEALPLSRVSESLYLQARLNLSPQLDSLYRVTERLLRANQLDDRPWQVKIADSNSVVDDDRSPTITIERKLLDRLAEDEAALAFVIAQKISSLNLPSFNPTVNAAAEREREQQKIESAHRDAALLGVAGMFSRDAIGGTVGREGQSVLSRLASRRVRRAYQERRHSPQIREDLVTARLESIKETDTLGYILTARAGFEAQGVLRAFDSLLAFASDYPGIPERKEALKRKIAEYPPEILSQEGKLHLDHSQSLAYKITGDGNTLVISRATNKSLF